MKLHRAATSSRLSPVSPKHRRSASGAIECLEARIAPATFTVVNINDSGAGSLRQAILDANATPAVADTITFNIPGGGPHTIVLASALPTISSPMTIDGQTEPNYAILDRPVVELRGTNTAAANGLTISAANVSVSGLVINDFDGHGIALIGNANNTTIRRCFIGTDDTGTIDIKNGGDGINVDTDGNIIGGVTLADRNVLSGNAGAGIEFTANASSNQVLGNVIGTNLLGSLQLPNAQQGVLVAGNSNQIGSAAAGAGNVISGNSGDNIDINGGDNNIIAGNIIGLDAEGERSLRSVRGGIYIHGDADNNAIGGAAAGARNIIAGHQTVFGNSVFIAGSGDGNLMINNIVGTNANGASGLGNKYGVLVQAPNTTIGDISGATRNVISANENYGISAAGVVGLKIYGNNIGMNPAGSTALGNSVYGIVLSGSIGPEIKNNYLSGNGRDGMYVSSISNGVIQGNVIGLNYSGFGVGNAVSGLAVFDNCTTLLIGGDTAAERNVISGNATAGIYVSNSSPVTIHGNYLGTNPGGTSALGGQAHGIYIAPGSNGNIIGGVNPGEGNLFGGNTTGIRMDSNANVFRGNIVGIDPTGTVKTQNFEYGVIVAAAGANNIIGGNTPAAANVICGSGISGVWITGTGAGNKISGNYIGTNAAGATGLGNAQHGINVNAPGTIVGGGSIAERNVISGNQIGRGINLSNAANAVVQNNYIGVNPSGTSALPNRWGLAFSGAGTNNAVVLDNVVSGNTEWGMSAGGNTGHVIRGNYIGTNAAGTTAVPNGTWGIELNNATSLTIGGSAVGQGNVISGNLTGGVELDGGGQHTVSGNLIGTNATGTAAIPNGIGLQILNSNGNSVGNFDAPNTISGNTSHGIKVQGGENNSIQYNRMGTNSAGNSLVANGGYGIRVQDSSLLAIGGSGDAGNLIRGNQAGGIFITGNTTTAFIVGNTVLQNTGVGVTFQDTIQTMSLGGATASLGNTILSNTGGGVLINNVTSLSIENNDIESNGGNGVTISGTSVGITVGGEGLGNTIASNTGKGVTIAAGSGHRLTENRIFGNTGIGIDLNNDGITANDADDADTGANGLQNGAVLAGSAKVNGETHVTGSLTTTPGAYRIEFFSGLNGGAQVFLEALEVQVDADGFAEFTQNVGAITNGHQVVATVTRVSTGDASEFSTVTTTVPILTIGNISVVEGNDGTTNAVFTANLSALPTVPVSFNFNTTDGTALAGTDYTATSNGVVLDGVQSTTFTVPILGDTIPERAELFRILIGNFNNVVVLNSEATATITDDDTTLVIDAKGRTATWRDLDGDLVTVKSSKGVLSVDDFVFDADGNGGQQLLELILSDEAAAANATNLSFIAKRAATSPNADGLVHVGRIDAAGLDLGSVLVSGDLGAIVVGDTVARTAGIKSLAVGSLGFFNFGGGSLHSTIDGALGKLLVRGDVKEASLAVSGAAGAITIGGSILAGSAAGSGVIEAGGGIAKVTIKGSIEGAAAIRSGVSIGTISVGGDITGGDAGRVTLSAAKSIAGLKVGGSVTHTDVLAGYDLNGNAVNPDASIGNVQIADNWVASNLVAGVTAGADGLFGVGGDDGVAPAGGGFTDVAKVLSKIGAVRVGGYLEGNAADPLDHQAITAQAIKSLNVGGIVALLTKGKDLVSLGTTGNAVLQEV